MLLLIPLIYTTFDNIKLGKCFYNSLSTSLKPRKTIDRLAMYVRIWGLLIVMTDDQLNYFSIKASWSAGQLVGWLAGRLVGNLDWSK